MRALGAVLWGVLFVLLELPLYLLLFVYAMFWMGSGLGIFLLPTPRPFWRDPGFWGQPEDEQGPDHYYR